jgi:hypothetical protein
MTPHITVNKNKDLVHKQYSAHRQQLPSERGYVETGQTEGRLALVQRSDMSARI